MSKIEEDFIAADSRNLPLIHFDMVYDYLCKDRRFNAEEMRGVKASRSSRQAYGDSAIGRVRLKRVLSTCIVKANVTPEHRVRSKPYSVTMIVEEKEEVVHSVECNDCNASTGGCKHAVAFLFWMNRRTENPSPTEVKSYWVAPSLSKVGTTTKFITTAELSEKMKPVSVKLPDNAQFLETIMSIAKEKQIDSQLSRYHFELNERVLYRLSIHYLLIDFLNQKHRTAYQFILFARNNMPDLLCKKAVEKTAMQSNDLLWFELRYGRITASKLYEAAHCSTSDGSLVSQILGASKTFDTESMKRGRELEKTVLKEVEKELGEQLSSCGIYLDSSIPVIGASPDAMGSNYVVEVKCPCSEKSLSKYILNGRPTPKFNAQINLQMMASKTKKGLFCVADPNFEKNKIVHKIWVNYNETLTSNLINKAMKFWEKNIFPKMFNALND